MSILALPEPDSSAPPRVAYAVGKRVGNAVTRNKVRRRLRAIVADVDRDGALPSGAYLIRADQNAAVATYSDLESAVRDGFAGALRRAEKGGRR